MVDPWQAYDGFKHDWINTQDLNAALAKAEEYNRLDILNDRAVIVRDFSSSVARKWQRAGTPKLDWVYIDANHLYPAAMEDLVEWSKVLVPGGYIMGHDYVLHPECGVIEAVEDFCADYGWEIQYLTASDNKNVPDWENIPSFQLKKK